MTGKAPAAYEMDDHRRHLSEMTSYYARTASKYLTWHIDPEHDLAVRELIALARSQGYASILDVCCGTGRALKACLDASIEAHGIDISQALIDEGAKKWRLPAEKFTCGDATSLPFNDKQFDASCVLGALHHSAIPEKIIAEMLRVSRYAIVVSDSGNSLHGGLRQILKRFGLFETVYRLIFRRAPRTSRRAILSEGDGPTFDFTIEEVAPAISSVFPKVKSYQFYRLGERRFYSRFYPRIFARQVVLIAHKPKS
jgi:ubiquinone/menaquinone biosynthesis C-methylase UbiE